MSDENLLMQYKFRFSSMIARVDKLYVKFTAGELPDPDNPGKMTRVDGKTTIYQRERPEPGSPDDWGGTYPRWKPGLEVEGGEPPGDLITYANEGIITLRWDIAKQGGKRENCMNEVTMDGVFIAFSKVNKVNGIPQYLHRVGPLDGYTADYIRAHIALMEKETGGKASRVKITTDDGEEYYFDVISTKTYE